MGSLSPSSPSSSPSSSSRRATRIWLPVLTILLLLTLIHFLLPPSHSSSSIHQPNYSNADLKAKNYLNSSEPVIPNPFDFCPSYSPGDRIGAKYGAVTLSKSRMHLGSGARIQRVLNKALAGQSVTISVLGGSVSACHGAGDDPISPTCYPSRFFQWWNTVFPHPATELTNGALRRTNSGYFGYCNSHHLPDQTDLVIIELDTEDEPNQDMMDHFEILIRSILIRPDKPAVLLLGHFSPQTHQTHGFAGPDHWHNIVAQFYDVPHVSVKSALFPDYMRDPKSIQKYFVDPVLASPSGHELISEILVAYFQSQICTAWSVATGSSYEAVPVHTAGSEGGGGDAHGLFGGIGQRPGVPEPEKGDLAVDAAVAKKMAAAAAAAAMKDRGDSSSSSSSPQLLTVPSGRINTRPNGNRPFEEIAPFCVSANDLINPLPPSLFYGSGWYAHHPSGSGGDALITAAHYWHSALPTSKLRIPIQVGGGDIGVYYLREPVGVVGEGSSVECWVDDNYAGAKVIENAADIGDAIPTLKMIDHYVGRGSHFVECQLLGEEGQSVPMFKIIGIFAT